MTPLEKLKLVADATTPGPWDYIKTGKQVIIRSDAGFESRRDYVAQINWGGHEADDWHVGSAKHIATFNPELVKAMIDALQAADKERDALFSGDFIGGGLKVLTEGLYDEAREQLDKLLGDG